MAKQFTCPKCGETFTPEKKVRAEKDAYGFEVGTKGSFIANLITTQPGISKQELIAATNAKFDSDSTGRVTMVLHQLRKAGHLKRDQGYQITVAEEPKADTKPEEPKQTAAQKRAAKKEAAK